MEKFISEMFGFLLTVVMMVGLFLTGLLWYNVNQFNSFKNQTEQVVERTGGLSNPARNDLDKLSKAYYHNHFVIYPAHNSNQNHSQNPVDKTYNDSTTPNGSVGYGHPIYLYIYSKIPLSLKSNGDNTMMYGNSFFSHKHNVATQSGEKKEYVHSNFLKSYNFLTVTSQVRQNSQQNIGNNNSNNNKNIHTHSHVHFYSSRLPYGNTHNDYHNDYNNDYNNSGKGFSNGNDNSHQAIYTPQND